MNESELIDELAEFCLMWKEQRDNDKTPLTIATVIKLKAKELTANKVKRFIAPTEIEVDVYSKEKNISLTGFYEYYESNGWRVGRNKMKNWKAAASGWAKRNYNKPETKKHTPDAIIAMARSADTPLGVLARIKIGSSDLNTLNSYCLRQRGQEILNVIDSMIDKCSKGAFTQHELSIMAKYGVSVG